MSSADPDSYQGPKDISFSTVLHSTNWAIGGCLRFSRLDFFSGDCLIFFHLKTLITTWRKQPERFIKFFHDSMGKICFFFALYNHIVRLTANIWLHVQNYLLHFPLISILKSKEISGNFIKQKVMSSADPDSNHGPKDISFSTVLRSTNWAIGGCLRFSRLDFLSADCLIFFHLKTLITTWRKQPEIYIKFFHDSMGKICFFRSL